MALKAIIFDFGGVLVRTEDRLPRRELAKELGMSYEEIDQLVFSSLSGKQAARGLISAQEHWEEIGKTLDLTPARLKDFRTRFFEGDRLDWELIEAIREWRGRYRVALLSNAWDDLRNYLDGTWHIMDDFDQIIISAEVGYTKPDHRIYRLALERLNVSAEQTLFVDDFVENVEAARQVGLLAIHFAEPQRAKEELRALLDGGH
jgi:epoxide hydrolase-like predicted phosphatase